MIMITIFEFEAYLMALAVIIFFVVSIVAWNFRRIKFYVLEWDTSNVGRLRKARKISDLLLKVSKERYVAVTTPPIADNNKRYYFTYLNDLHTVSIKDGKVISDKMLKEYQKELLEDIAKNLRKKGLESKEIQIKLSKTFKPKIESIPPHKFTNLVIAKIVQRKVFESLLVSLTKSNLFMYIVMVVLGIFIGITVQNYLLLYNQFPLINTIVQGGG